MTTPAITDVMVSVYPGADTEGNVLKETIWVLFNQEIDELSVDEGNFLVEGPQPDSLISPGIDWRLPDIDDSGGNNNLISPRYDGIVPGKISFQRIDLSDTNLYTGANDTAGNGSLWRTKAIFTPSFPLKP